MEIIFLLIGALIGGAVAFAINYFFDKKDSNPDFNSINLKLDKIMADSAQIKQQVIDLNAKVDTLQTKVDAEQETINALFATNAEVVTGLNAEIARLQAIIDGGGIITPEDLQTISDGIQTATDKLATTEADIEGTVS